MAASSGKGLSNAATGGAPKEAVVTGSGLGFETTGWGVTAFFSSVASRLPPDEEGAASGAWLWLAGELEEMTTGVAGASFGGISTRVTVVALPGATWTEAIVVSE
jgi:hypothetical protein